eukprot:364773-Chlamydomonas_euryale.AAC.6
MASSRAISDASASNSPLATGGSADAMPRHARSAVPPPLPLRPPPPPPPPPPLDVLTPALVREAARTCGRQQQQRRRRHRRPGGRQRRRQRLRWALSRRCGPCPGCGRCQPAEARRFRGAAPRGARRPPHACAGQPPGLALPSRRPLGRPLWPRPRGCRRARRRRAYLRGSPPGWTGPPALHRWCCRPSRSRGAQQQPRRTPRPRRRRRCRRRRGRWLQRPAPMTPWLRAVGRGGRAAGAARAGSVPGPLRPAAVAAAAAAAAAVALASAAAAALAAAALAAVDALAAADVAATALATDAAELQMWRCHRRRLRPRAAAPRGPSLRCACCRAALPRRQRPHPLARDAQLPPPPLLPPSVLRRQAAPVHAPPLTCLRAPASIVCPHAPGLAPHRPLQQQRLQRRRLPHPCLHPTAADARLRHAGTPGCLGMRVPAPAERPNRGSGCRAARVTSSTRERLAMAPAPMHQRRGSGGCAYRAQTQRPRRLTMNPSPAAAAAAADSASVVGVCGLGAGLRWLHDVGQGCVGCLT